MKILILIFVTISLASCKARNSESSNLHSAEHSPANINAVELVSKGGINLTFTGEATGRIDTTTFKKGYCFLMLNSSAKGGLQIRAHFTAPNTKKAVYGTNWLYIEATFNDGTFSETPVFTPNTWVNNGRYDLGFELSESILKSQIENLRIHFDENGFPTNMTYSLKKMSEVSPGIISTIGDKVLGISNSGETSCDNLVLESQQPYMMNYPPVGYQDKG